MATKTTDTAKRQRTKEAVRAVLDRNLPAIWRLLTPTIDDWLERQRADKLDPRQIPPGAAIHSLLTECVSQDVAYLLACIDAELTAKSHREIADVFGYSANTVKQSWSQWLEPTSGGEYRIADICSHLFSRDG